MVYFNKHLHLVFIDVKKAYDKVPRDLIWWVLNKMSVWMGYIQIIRDMYDGAVMSMRTTNRGIREFSMIVDVHQMVNLKPLSLYTNHGWVNYSDSWEDTLVYVASK